MRSYFLLWSKQTTPDPSRSGGRMDLSARKIKRIKHWSYVGTSLTLTRSYGEKAAQESLFWNLIPLRTTWPTPGWPIVGKKTPQAPLYFPCLWWFWRWLHVGVIGELEPAWYVSDESHIAYGFNSAHSLHCEMLRLYSLSMPPLFLFKFFSSLRAISGSRTPPFEMVQSYLWLGFYDSVIHQRKCLWRPPSMQLSGNFKQKNKNDSKCVFSTYEKQYPLLLW